MRSGIDDTSESERNFFHILDGSFELGVSAVTVHGRTVQQKYVGPSKWEFLAKVKKHIGDRVVLGSGDLFAPDDVRAMMEQTGVDGVTLARGCIGNPFLFAQVRAVLNGGQPESPSTEEQRGALSMHWHSAREVYGDKLGLRRTRTHAIKYAKIHPDPVAVRDAFVRMRSSDEFEAVLEQWYQSSRDRA
jgi:tRNA-dihydrouridine synthase